MGRLHPASGRLQARVRRHRVEAAQLALSLGGVARLDQEQEPGRARGGDGHCTVEQTRVIEIGTLRRAGYVGRPARNWWKWRDKAFAVGIAPRHRRSEGAGNMRNGDVALRFSIVFAVAGFVAFVASIYEIDRREKSTSETVRANLIAVEQRIQVLNDQIRILNEQYSSQLNATEHKLQALGAQIESIESRQKELEGNLSGRR